ncbi:acyl-CoA dehydrogenase family protein [Streptomyces sp. R11]|uniref:Acyl-CoA dehydrogenase family protein n=1 Tax=Streptomyces sp. R11 TaxID=3238625 RepID=A0AB39NF56_9ACTN
MPPLPDHNSADDRALLEALHREGAGWAEAELRQVGEFAGSREAREWGRLANEHLPVLHTHDRYGHRVDEVEFHPSWHQLMTASVTFGLTGSAWQEPRPGAHVARTAKQYLMSQVEAGHTCPIDMGYSVVPSLRSAPELARQYEPLLSARQYDFGLRPPLGKAGLLAGMSMTEKQGGSDIRANTSRAVPAGDGAYRLTGHKWFTSAPMCDVFLVVAQAPQGPTCFFLPRVLPDGSLNGMRIQRLKNKLGNRSNASSEIEYDDALVWPVGEEGRGVPTIIAMVNATRLCAINSSAGLMRAGLVNALHHAQHRRVFGKLLVNQPMMRNVLADLVLESEAAVAVTMRLAAATDRAERGDTFEAALRRIGVAVTKYHICKRASTHLAEAMECLGGNGYVEDSGMPRLYREAPLNSIWEGSGNVAALDVLRAISREPSTIEAFKAEIDAARGGNRHLDEASKRIQEELSDATWLEVRARRIAELMATALQASLLVRHGRAAVADAFCATRLGGDWGQTLGTLPPEANLKAIVEGACTI